MTVKNDNADDAGVDPMPWVKQTIDYLNAVRARRIPNTTPYSKEESEAISTYSTPEIGGLSLQHLDSHIGPTLRLASDLEWQVAGMLSILTAPDDPLEHVDAIMGLTARKRTEMMRRVAGKDGQWIAFVDEIERIAEARNVIAHGTWDFFQRDPDLHFGWFVSIVKKNDRKKPFKVRTEEYDDEKFSRLRTTANLLILVCETIEFTVAGAKFAHGVSVIPPDLNKAVRFHASGFRADGLSDIESAILDELFPPDKAPKTNAHVSP